MRTGISLAFLAPHFALSCSPSRRLAVLCAMLSQLLAAPLMARPPAPPNRAVVQLAQQALAAHRAGDQKRAADLYFRAHQLDPGDGAFLWGSARSLQLDGQLDLAEVRYVAFLQLETADPDLRDKAVTYLAELRAELAQRRARVVPPPVVPLPPEPSPVVVPAPPPEPPVAIAPPPPEVVAPVEVARPQLSRLRQGLFWGTLAVAAGGASLLAVASWQRDAFNTAMAPGFSGGKVTEYPDRATALRAGDAITLRQNLGVAALVLGTAGALTTWLLPRAPVESEDRAKIQVFVAPTTAGWTVAARAPW